MHFAQIYFPVYATLVDWFMTLASIDAARILVSAPESAASPGSNALVAFLARVPVVESGRPWAVNDLRGARKAGAASSNGAGADQMHPMDARQALVVQVLATVLARNDKAPPRKQKKDGRANPMQQMQGGAPPLGLLSAGRGHNLIRRLLTGEQVTSALFAGIQSADPSWRECAHYAFQFIFQSIWPRAGQKDKEQDGDTAEAASLVLASSALTLVPHYVKAMLDSFPGKTKTKSRHADFEDAIQRSKRGKGVGRCSSVVLGRGGSRKGSKPPRGGGSSHRRRNSPNHRCSSPDVLSVASRTPTPARCEVDELSQALGMVCSALDWSNRPPASEDMRRFGKKVAAVFLWCLGELQERILNEIDEMQEGHRGREFSATSKATLGAPSSSAAAAAAAAMAADPSRGTETVEALCLVFFHLLRVVPSVALPAACEMVRRVVHATAPTDDATGRTYDGVALGMNLKLRQLLQHAILTQPIPPRREVCARWLLHMSATNFVPPPQARL